MKMICDVPDEVIKSVRMGTWCGSSVAEKMIANGIPLEQLRAEIIARDKNIKAVKSDGCCFFTAEEVLQILDKYKSEQENN